MARFLTIPKTGEAVYREKMSRFLSFALPVASVDDAKETIALYANEYHDARHVCWAYMVGADRLTYLSSDNGEPSGTAGKPILGQINSMGLTDVVVIVVRYFGGIKLGTSG
ncbi:MAG: YigZ family protein, partial [Duncaniella sp.]|nr:YigZ family protein [Duncaniella sp.]